MERRKSIKEWVAADEGSYREAMNKLLDSKKEYWKRNREEMFQRRLETKKELEEVMALVPDNLTIRKSYEDCIAGIENFNSQREEMMKEFRDLSRRCAHEPLFGKLDLSEEADEIKNEDVEHMCYLCLDRDRKLVKKFKITSGSEDSVSSADMRRIEFQIIVDPEIDSVITLHNHPDLANSGPSAMDDYCDFRFLNLLKCADKRLLDTCVVTPIDFYSRRQDESSGKKLIAYSPLLGVRKCFTHGELEKIEKKCPVVAQFSILPMTDNEKI